jgi:F420-dependent oxidoreductase-like protein
MRDGPERLASERDPAQMEGDVVRLGVHVGFLGLGVTAQDQRDMAIEAERLGYDSVWASEAYGSDAATTLAWLAAQTSTIRLGAGIFQMPGRTAAMTAMTAATIDQLSGGRMVLGLGSSGPQVAEGWHGQPFSRQLMRTREYVAVVRKALARERLEFHGETIRVPLAKGAGKALKLSIDSVQNEIPIYLAAMGPRNTALAGEIADGCLPMLFSPEHATDLRRLLEEGALRAERSLEHFDLAPTVNVFVTTDLEAARNSMRPSIALYVGGMGSPTRNFYNALVARYGFEREAREIQEHFLAGRRERAMAAIPDALIDAVSICGPRERAAERLAALREAGVGTLVITPTAPSAVERLNQLRVIAELAS